MDYLNDLATLAELQKESASYLPGPFVLRYDPDWLIYRLVRADDVAQHDEGQDMSCARADDEALANLLTAAANFDFAALHAALAAAPQPQALGVPAEAAEFIGFEEQPCSSARAMREHDSAWLVRPAYRQVLTALEVEGRHTEAAAIRNYVKHLVWWAQEEGIAARTASPSPVPLGGGSNPFYPADDWHDELGDVLWWRFPIDEPPYVGSPLDTDWHPINTDYYTHFQKIDLRGYDHEAAQREAAAPTQGKKNGHA